MMQATSRRLLQSKTATTIRSLTALSKTHNILCFQSLAISTTSRRNEALPVVARFDPCARTFSTTTSNDETAQLNQQNDLIKQYAEQGQLNDAHQLLVLMQKQDDPVYPDASAYSSVLHALLLDEDQTTTNNSEDGDDDENIYRSCERATELLFTWLEAAAASELLRNSPHTMDYNAVLQAWLQVAHIKGVPQRSQHVLERMEQQQEETMVWSLVTIESYNTVLQTWANSKEHLRGTMAQALLDRIYTTNTETAAATAPDGTSLRIMMEAWVKSGETKAAFRATGHLMKLLRLSERDPKEEDLQPKLEDYYSVFKAWTTARDKHAAQKSLSVLRLIEYAYLNRFSDIRADLNIFRWILQAYAKSDASPELGEDVDSILEKIWDMYLVPDTECFAAAIQAHVNCALHKDLGTDPWPLAQRAHSLLDEMLKAVQRSETVTVSTEHYNMVLKAYTGVAFRDASEPALKLLDTMEQSIDQRPDAASYALAIMIVSKSYPAVADKVKMSQDILARAKQEYETGTNDAAKPNVQLYNSLLRACAASTSGSDVQREQTFRLALQTMKQEIKNPDPDTFYCLIEAASNLLPSGTVQNKALEHIFGLCAKAGLVDRVLLTRFRLKAPDDVFVRVVVDHAELDEDGTRIVPWFWTRNVIRSTQGLVVEQQQQRKATGAALTVQGNLHVTSKMKDARMKTIRSRKTQKLLRGGRLYDNSLEEEPSFTSSAN